MSDASQPANPRILSIQIGRPATYDWPQGNSAAQRNWTTSFFRQPVSGPVSAGPLGLTGDEVADTANHGGPDKALLAYSADHYPRWQAELQMPEVVAGGFGENLTIAGLCEDTVCVGDRWRLGSVLFEVSQPRQPCWKLARRWNLKHLPALVIANGRTGWYLRVVSSGLIEEGQSLELVARPWPRWTIDRANQVMHRQKGDRALAAELAGVPQLSASWQAELRKRIAE